MNAVADEIRRALESMVEPGTVFEVRALEVKTGSGYGQTWSGYFDAAHLEQAAAAIERLSEQRKAPAVYITLNPCNPDLLARAANRIRPMKKKDSATSDEDIFCRRFLPIDFDAVRVSGISSTDEEHQAALERAAAVREYLSGQGWPEPIEGDSGNGAHLLYRVDLPANDGGTVARCLAALAARFNDERVKVDTTTANPARIWKCYGTMARKGDDVPGRPHRRAKLLRVPADLQAVPSVLLLELAGPVAVSVPAKRGERHGGPGLQEWVTAAGLPVARTETTKDGGTRFILAECPFDASHKDAALYEAADGARGFSCFHNSCKGYKWKDVRDKYEPRAGARATAPAPEPPGAPEPADSEPDVDFTRLAALSVVEYEQAREAGAKRLGVRVSVLDKEVAKLRKQAADSRGLDELFTDTEPWPEPVDGAELLDELAATFTRFCILPEFGAVVLALWVVFTWSLSAFMVAAILLLTSPEKRCGKTTVLSVLGRLVCRALPCSNVSAAALFRSIEKWTPALLIDEADSFLTENEELRGVLNSGHTRETAYSIRVEGDAANREPRRFFTWGAKAVAMIGKPAGTIIDRSIILEMRRKLAGERVERLRHAAPAGFEILRRKCARWVEDNGAELLAARPELPTVLNDRQQDNWEPLFSIAMVAGKEWLARARAAALALSGVAELDDASSVRVLLLSDIREYFESVKNPEWVRTADLLEYLNGLAEHPWPEFQRGRPLSAAGLARMLKPFGLKSGTFRTINGTVKGYRPADFQDTFRRYISSGNEPPPPEPPTPPPPEAPPTEAPAPEPKQTAQYPISSPEGCSEPKQPKHSLDISAYDENKAKQKDLMFRVESDAKSNIINDVSDVSDKAGGVERDMVSNDDNTGGNGGNGGNGALTPGLCEHRAGWLLLTPDALAALMANRMDETNFTMDDGALNCMGRVWQAIKNREGSGHVDA